MTEDQRSTWLQKTDGECPYQMVLPRRQLMDDSDIMDFLLSYVDLYVEHQCPAYVLLFRPHGRGDFPVTL